MEQDELLKYAIAVLERRGLRYALVGSFASGIWGETRFTPDMDIAGILKIGDELVDRDYLAEQAARLGVLDIWPRYLATDTRGITIARSFANKQNT